MRWNIHRVNLTQAPDITRMVRVPHLPVTDIRRVRRDVGAMRLRAAL